MKKILITAIAVFGFSFANAQETKFGVKAGMNLSNITGDNTDENDMKVGFHAGAFVNIGVSDKFSVQPEILYSMQGAKDNDGSLDLSYLNIPIMARYLIAEKFSLEAGPQIGILMSAKSKSDGGGDVDVKDFLNTTDIGIGVGAAYDITENIGVGLRYTLGVSNINKEGDDSNNNSNIGISLGYRF